MKTPKQSWERQTGESTPSFAAFAVYRDIGATRSVTKVSQQLHKSRPLIGRWSAQHAWVMRAAAFDDDRDRTWLIERRERVREAARRNAEIAAAAMDLVARKVEQLTLDDLDANSMVALIGAASRLESLALGSPTMAVAISGADGGPVLTAEVSLLTDEERLHRMEVLRRELESRIGNGEPMTFQPDAITTKGKTV